MGGAATEVNEATRDVLIEAADFDPVSVRTTARCLGLHSDSSYRFERGVDPEGIDWASRRCAELILELAGGELAAGVVDVGRRPAPRPPIVLRLGQLKRILGIEIDPAVVRRILSALGNVEHSAREEDETRQRGDAETVSHAPPRPLAASAALSSSTSSPARLLGLRPALLAARSIAGDRSDRRGGADPRLRPDSRRRERADGRLDPSPRRSRRCQDPRRAHCRRLRRGHDPSAPSTRPRRDSSERGRGANRSAAGRRSFAGPIVSARVSCPACWPRGGPTSRFPIR